MNNTYQTQSATVAGNNVAQIQNKRNRDLLITRAVITGPTDSQCLLYIGGITPSQYRDGSTRGQQDYAEYPQGLYWPAGNTLYFVWDKAGVATAFVAFDDPGGNVP